MSLRIMIGLILMKAINNDHPIQEMTILKTNLITMKNTINYFNSSTVPYTVTVAIFIFNVK